jgi:BASS family bile acid:Na+ symporter
MALILFWVSIKGWGKAMLKIRQTIENNFSLLLLIGLVVGLFLPSFGEFSDEIVIFLTALLIFLSCADIEPRDFIKVDIFQIGLFTLARFAVFPLVLFYLAQQFVPEFAIGVLLLALMPAGVAVASLCSMSKANVSLGLSLTIISSLLAPAFIPSVFSFLGQVVAVDVAGLFTTLMLVVIVPIVLYFG